MKSGKIFLIAIAAVGLLYLMSQFVAYNQMIMLEANIPAKDKKAQNSLATFTNNVPTQLGIVGQNVEATKDIVREWSKGKYGDTGFKALFP